MFLDSARQFMATGVKKLTTGADFQKVMAEILSKSEVGDEVKTPQGAFCGVFLGRVKFPAKKGLSAKREFYVVVAPENLGSVPCSFSEAKALVGGLKKRHGASGAFIDSEWDLFSGLDDGRFLNRWVIPPLEILTGCDNRLNMVNKKANIDAQVDRGLFAKVFADDLDGEFPRAFWTCSQSAQLGEAKDRRASHLLGTSLTLFPDIRDPEAKAFVRPCMFVSVPNLTI